MLQLCCRSLPHIRGTSWAHVYMSKVLFPANACSCTNISQSLDLGPSPLVQPLYNAASTCKLAMFLVHVTLCTLATQPHSSLGFEASILVGDQSIAAHQYIVHVLVFTLIRLILLLCVCSLQHFLQCVPFGSLSCIVKFLSGEHIPC